MFEKAKLRRQARKIVEAGGKEVKPMCDYAPYQLYPADGDTWYLAQISRGQSVCPIIVRGRGYEAVRQAVKNVVANRGYKGYHLGIREIA